jgi:hypothetical protein
VHGVDLYLDQQAIDTTTPADKLRKARAELAKGIGIVNPGICMCIPTARVGCVSIRECFFDEDELD